MASVVQTTAVALRRGNTVANETFTGVQGELVVDLGADGTGTDLNTTLRLHNAITTGGIPMARGDMANVTSKALAENRPAIGDKNLAYADLSNIETASNPSNIIAVLTSYGFAQSGSIEPLLTDYAKKDMSNVNTANLATGAGQSGKHSGKNLAYADTSNINTADLVDGTKHTGTSGDKILAYADAANINTTNLTTNRGTGYGPVLMKNDLTNVASGVLDDLFNTTYNVEKQSNKDASIPTNSADIVSGHYPQTSAVKNYLDAALISLLDRMWPVGSVYSCWHDACPLEALIPGSEWEMLPDTVPEESEGSGEYYINRWLRIA